MQLDKTILVDADGVLLSWDKGFSNWMGKLGHTECNQKSYSLSERYQLPDERVLELAAEFSLSDDFAYLDSFQDSSEYVAKLHNMGFDFVCITSASDSNRTRDLRWQNLQRHFGAAVVDLHCLPLLGCKRDTLSRWARSNLLWIEDHPRNAIVGKSLGLDSVLVSAVYNHGEYGVPRVSFETPWQEIHNIALTKYSLK